MENIIKGLDILQNIERPEIDQMEQAALIQWQNHKLEFKILDNSDKKVTIRVTQDKSVELFPVKRLVEITHETFEQHFPGKKILVHPVAYKESPVEIVDSKWIQSKMLKTGITLKTIKEETGLNKTYLSALINGIEGKPLSQAMKAMFYFYFAAKEK